MTAAILAMTAVASLVIWGPNSGAASFAVLSVAVWLFSGSESKMSDYEKSKRGKV